MMSSQPQLSVKIIDGKFYADQLLGQIAQQVQMLKEEEKVTPGLAVILIGDDPASILYVGMKTQKLKKMGMKSQDFHLPATITLTKLLALIDQLNADPNIHGILIQLPLPSHLPVRPIIDHIDPAKDVDGLHSINAGYLANGYPSIVPCTPAGCLYLLQQIFPKGLEGKNALVIGRSALVGRPMAWLLLQQNCTVTIAHRHTVNLAGQCRRADIIIAAAGKAHLVKADWVKSGAVVIDVGINKTADPTAPKGYRLQGDVDFLEVLPKVKAITPVPGGVGPMTVAFLLHNTLKLCYKRLGKPDVNTGCETG